MGKISYAGYRFPPEVIDHAIWLYLRFTLSFRDVEDLLAERGIAVSYETVRRWVNHFGPIIATQLRKRRPKPHATWHLQNAAHIAEKAIAEGITLKQAALASGKVTEELFDKTIAPEHGRQRPSRRLRHPYVRSGRKHDDPLRSHLDRGGWQFELRGGADRSFRRRAGRCLLRRTVRHPVLRPEELRGSFVPAWVPPRRIVVEIGRQPINKLQLPALPVGVVRPIRVCGGS
jgi:hypothetical protein